MFDEAIKIDPKFAIVYNNKGSTKNIIIIIRIFA